MTKTARPQWSTISTWDQLDKLALDYRRLETRLRARNASVVDCKCVERTAMQLEAARNQVSLGEIEHATAIAVMQAAEQMFPLMRDLMYARSPQPQSIPYTLVEEHEPIGYVIVDFPAR